MKELSLVFIVMVFVGCGVQAHTGVDMSTLLSQSIFECLKGAGMEFAVPRAYHSYGALDTNAV